MKSANSAASTGIVGPSGVTHTPQPELDTINTTVID
jgi:hypothetical protein